MFNYVTIRDSPQRQLFLHVRKLYQRYIQYHHFIALPSMYISYPISQVKHKTNIKIRFFPYAMLFVDE